MQHITPKWKVAEVIDRWPETAQVFMNYQCPDMRAGFPHLMARMLSIQSTARMRRIPLDRLMEDLNQVVAEDDIDHFDQ